MDALLSTFVNLAQKDIKRIDEKNKELELSLNDISNENTNLRKEVDDLKIRQQLSEGLIAQLKSKLAQQDEQIIELTARSMRDNIVVQGIPEDRNETWADTKEKLKDFVKNDLKIDPTNVSIDRAHRSGVKGRGPRQIIAKIVNQDSKDLIFRHCRNLQGKPHLKVQEQLPAVVNERRKRLWPKYKNAKANLANKVSWSLDKLVINGITHSALDDNQVIDFKTDLDCKVVVHHTDHTIEDGSTFMGHSARIDKKTDVPGMMAKILQDRSIAGATHNMYAYRVTTADGKLCEGQKDDGEHGAGFRLLKLLRDQEQNNVMIVVTRWYGNKHMGAKRFQCIENSAKSALEALDAE
jgi:hypothetical protein